MLVRWQVFSLLTAIFLFHPSALAQSSNNGGLPGSAPTPLILPGSSFNLNPIGSPGSRLLNNNLGFPGTLAPLGSPANNTLPNLNFGTSSLGRLSPPAGATGISGIGRLTPPGSGPSLDISPNLTGPPTLSGSGLIAPISNPSASLATGGSFGGPIGTSNPPSINPTNPTSFNEPNPTGSSALRTPSNNYRP
jgi:hypothetical protein